MCSKYRWCYFVWLALGVVAAVGATPNVLIIYADDMGWGNLAVQNPQSKIPTPHLDRLAREGTRFTDAHSSSGVCTPSRYALLHGRFHWLPMSGPQKFYRIEVETPAP
jgi:arylsulfatase A